MFNYLVKLLSTENLAWAIAILLASALFTVWKTKKTFRQLEAKIDEDATVERIRLRVEPYEQLMQKLGAFSATKVVHLSKRAQRTCVTELIESIQGSIFGQFGLLASHETRETALRLRAKAMDYLENQDDIGKVLLAAYKLHQMMRSDLGVPQPNLKSSIDRLRARYSSNELKSDGTVEYIETVLEEVKHLKWHQLVQLDSVEEMSIELVIFDCDGVLVDSERIANQVFSKIIEEEAGLTIDAFEMYNTFVGCSRSRCMEILHQRYGVSETTNILNRYDQEIDDALSQNVQAVVGIREVLDKLELPYCVASSGTHKKIRTSLSKTNLLEYFEGKIFSSEDVAHGKPSPDLFLHAAKSMGDYNSEKCLVIEDSPIGIQAAIAAEMKVYGYAELLDSEKLLEAGAMITFKDMNELLSENIFYDNTLKNQA